MAASLISVLAENLANFIGSGLQSFGFSAALQPFCDNVERFDPTVISNSSILGTIESTFEYLPSSGSARASAKGIGARYGPQAAYLALMYGIWTEGGGMPGSIVDTNPDDMSWSWQTCTEFGYFQIANASSPDNLLSTFVNETSWEQTQCLTPFPYAPALPNTSALVNKYGGWNMNPSQVMFTDGLLDPWHTLSVQSTSSEIGAPSRKTTSTIPACGKSPDGTSVFGLLYPDSYHVSDLLYDREISPDSYLDGVELFSSALDKWLPCFQKHSITSNSTSSGATALASPSHTQPTSSATGTGTDSGSGSGPASTSPVGKGAGSVATANAQLAGLAALVAVTLFL